MLDADELDVRCDPRRDEHELADAGADVEDVPRAGGREQLAAGVATATGVQKRREMRRTSAG